MSNEVTSPRRRGVWRRLLRWCVSLGLTFLALSVSAVVTLRFLPPPISAFMLERWVSAKLDKEEHFTLHYKWMAIADVSPDLPIALIAAEDQKFPAHHGFDVQAIQEAIEDADAGEKLRGASTITQQTAKNLFLWGGRSTVRKGLEAYFAVLLEACWSKRRILEVYLNVAEFGDGVYGAAAASQYYFHKPPNKINAREAALLAAVLPNPKRYRVDQPSSYVIRRVEWIERQVRQLGGTSYSPR